MKNKLMAKDLRNLNDTELVAKYQTLKDEILQLKIQMVTHQKIANPTRFSIIRRDMARILTVQNEKRRKK